MWTQRCTTGCISQQFSRIKRFLNAQQPKINSKSNVEESRNVSGSARSLASLTSAFVLNAHAHRLPPSPADTPGPLWGLLVLWVVTLLSLPSFLLEWEQSRVNYRKQRHPVYFPPVFLVTSQALVSSGCIVLECLTFKILLSWFYLIVI